MKRAILEQHVVLLGFTAFALLMVTMPLAAQAQVASIQMQLSAGESVPDYELEAVGTIPGCSATLVSDRVVLTAAHCVCPNDDNRINCATRRTFTLHSVFPVDDPTTGLDESQNRQNISISGDVFVHPNFGVEGWLREDLSVIVLDQQVSQLAKVAPIPIEDPNSIPQVGELITLVGFGSTGPNCKEKSEGKMQLTLPAEAVSDGGIRFVQTGQHSCPGDSGGPALNANNRVVGVASWSNSSEESTYRPTFSNYWWLSGVGQESESDVAFNALNGEYLVAYVAGDTSSAPSGVGFEVYIRMYASDGSVGDMGTLVSSSGREPALTYNEDRNEYLLVYVAPHPDGRTMYSQRLNAAGDPLGSRQEIAYDRSGLHDPAVAYNSLDSGYFVVWRQSVEDFITPYQLQSDIYGQRLAADGSQIGGEITISTWEYSQIRPQVAFNSVMNQFLVVWEDHHWGWGDASDIYGRILGADGTLLGGSFAIAWERENRRENPVVAFDSLSNSYLVVYEYEYSENDIDIYLRRVLSSGALNGNETPLALSWNSETRPAVTFNQLAGEYLVVWQYAYSATDQDIEGQFMSSDGSTVSGKFWIARSGRSETSPSLAMNERLLDGQRIFYQFEYSTIDRGILSRKALIDGSLAR